MTTPASAPTETAAQPTDRESRFIDYLRGLHAREDRGALAALRRSLGHSPGEVPGAMRYVEPWLGTNVSNNDEWRFYLVAGLFALHPADWNDSGDYRSNLGTSFRRLARATDSEDSIERRFVVLLNCHHDNLAHHLRGAVSLLKSNEVAVNWRQLLHDLRGWGHDDRYIQRNWARAFWDSPGLNSGNDVPSDNELATDELNTITEE